MTKNFSDVSNYYSEKVLKHGDTPEGVDWNSESGQSLRFTQLLKLISDDQSFSIYDFGCGYGALVDYLFKTKKEFKYLGYDFSADMIRLATQKFSERKHVAWTTDENTDANCDYAVASGVLNVKFERSNEEWLENLVKPVINKLHQKSRKGFAFNCLTSYSDAEKMKNYLYYADPNFLFDYCKKHFSRNVALLHDYDLYEFTILVRK